MNNLTKLYQIQELINKSQLHFPTENRLELNEYVGELISTEERKIRLDKAYL